jgi:hypothetical protein
MAVSHKRPEQRTGKRPRRPNGEGSIYETADGRLRGALVVTNPATGRPARRIVTGRTRAEVSRKLDALRREAASGNLATGTTAEYLTRWLESGRHSIRPSSWRQREQNVRNPESERLLHEAENVRRARERWDRDDFENARRNQGHWFRPDRDPWATTAPNLISVATDREAAWDELHAATPPGWFVGRPTYHMERRERQPARF